MKTAPWLTLIRISALFALGASGALLADYSGQAPTYCVAGSGCAAIRQAGWGYIPGINIPVPLAGTVAFALLLTVTLLPNERPQKKLSAAGGIAAGVIALALIGIQAIEIGAFCTLCLMVDLSAIVAGVAGVMLLRGDGRPDFEPLTYMTWAVIGAIAFLAPWYWPKARPAPDVPPQIHKLYQPGKINVVEFADFECPYCRRLHPTLKKLNQEYGDKVHFIRLNLPLAGHPSALPAAIAYVCADEQGKGEAASDFLFAVPSLVGAERKLVKELALDAKKFEACLDSKEANERVERESKILRDAGFDGLPTTYVGSAKIIGAQSEETFRAAYERAAQGTGQRGVPLPIYLIVVLAAIGGIAFAGRVRSQEEQPAAGGAAP